MGGHRTGRVLGLDLAAAPANTAAATLVGSRVESVEVGVDDDRILALSHGAEKIGVDCPLGWPRAFVQFMAAVASGGPPAPARTIAERLPLAYRATDRWVATHRPPLRPLSVSADRIAHVAFRCAGLTARWDAADRSGAGLVVETYPAGSLHAWKLPYRGYKGASGAPVRGLIVDAVCAAFDLGAHEESCRRSDHALDAVLCALTAHAVLSGMATRPDDEQLSDARVEGWIAFPTGSLRDLAG